MILAAQAIILSMYEGGGLQASITQHDALWVLIGLGILALLIYIVGWARR